MGTCDDGASLPTRIARRYWANFVVAYGPRNDEDPEAAAYKEAKKQARIREAPGAINSEASSAESSSAEGARRLSLGDALELQRIHTKRQDWWV